MIHRRLTTSSLLPGASTLSSGCAPIQTSRLVMPIIVWSDTTTPIELIHTFRVQRETTQTRQRTVPAAATFTAAGGVDPYPATTSIGKLAKARMRLLSLRTGTPGLIVTTLAARADSTAFPSKRANPMPAQAWTP